MENKNQQSLLSPDVVGGDTGAACVKCRNPLDGNFCDVCCRDMVTGNLVCGVSDNRSQIIYGIDNNRYLAPILGYPGVRAI